MSRKAAALLALVPFPVYLLLSGWGIDRGYPTALYALTVSLCEERSVALDAHRDLLGYDWASRAGHFYSDKAPGPAFLMVPAYLLARHVARDADARFSLTVLLGMLVPASTAPLAMGLLLARAGAPHPLYGGLGFAFASLFFPYATVAISDPLTAAAVAWAYALALGKDGRGLLLSGAAAGFACLSRYQAALLIAPLAIALCLSAGRAALRFLLPLAFACLLLASYHQLAFGHPLAFPTTFWRGKLGQAPTLQVSRPTPARISSMAFSERRGLLVFTPVLLLCPLGAWDLLRRAPRTAAIVLASLLLYGGYLACNVGWVGGADFGMRFSVDALPLLWLCAMSGDGRIAGRLRALLCLPSAAIALLGALAAPYVPLGEPHPFAYEWRALLDHGPRTIFDGAPRTP